MFRRHVKGYILLDRCFPTNYQICDLWLRPRAILWGELGEYLHPDTVGWGGQSWPTLTFKAEVHRRWWELGKQLITTGSGSIDQRIFRMKVWIICATCCSLTCLNCHIHMAVELLTFCKSIFQHDGYVKNEIKRHSHYFTLTTPQCKTLHYIHSKHAILLHVVSQDSLTVCVCTAGLTAEWLFHISAFQLPKDVLLLFKWQKIDTFDNQQELSLLLTKALNDVRKSCVREVKLSRLACFQRIGFC